MNLGFWEWVAIAVVVMLLFGTKRLRTAGEDLGSAIRGFKKVWGKKQTLSMMPHTLPKWTKQKNQKKLYPIVRTRQTIMFDVGFFEVLLVGIVALCLFGPEELLVFAKSIGRWIGRLRRMKHKLLEEMRDIERHSSQHD